MMICGEVGGYSLLWYEGRRKIGAYEPPQKTPLAIAAELGANDAKAFAAAQPFLSQNLAHAACAKLMIPFWVGFDGGHYDPCEKIACYREAFTKTLLELAR